MVPSWGEIPFSNLNLCCLSSQKAMNDPLVQRYSTIILELSPQISSLDCSSLSSRTTRTLSLSSCQQHLTLSSSRFILVMTLIIHHRRSKYPVEVFYTQELERDFVEAAIRTVLMIHHSEDWRPRRLFFILNRRWANRGCVQENQAGSG